MIISNEKLKTLFKGAVSFEEKDSYLTPMRYSREQIEYMARPEYDWGWRMRAGFTGCVRIEMITTATTLSLEYRASHSHTRSNTVDIYVDNDLVESYAIRDKLEGKITVSLKTEEKQNGEKRLVRAYMPCECRFDIKNVEIDATECEPTPKAEKTMLIFGDSITQGAGPALSSYAYANILQRLTGYEIIAQGIGGYRFEPQDLRRVEGVEPDMLLVFLGTNYYEIACEKTGYDYKQATEQYFARLTELYNDTPITVITPLYRTNAYEWERFLWCIQTIKNACKPYKIKVIDGFDLMPSDTKYLADGVHPNIMGTVCIANKIFEAY